jgi:hypothetical protein
VKYEITEGESFQSDVRVFRVRKPGGSIWTGIDVWASEERGKMVCRCTACSGPVAAMLTTCRHATAVARYLKKESELYFFVVDTFGKRRLCYGKYNGGKPAAVAACAIGETVEGRRCPYPGCPCDETARPPCALCYE